MDVVAVYVTNFAIYLQARIDHVYFGILGLRLGDMVFALNLQVF